MKPEVHVPENADWIMCHINPFIFLGEQHGETNVSIVRCQGEGESKIAAFYWKWILNRVYRIMYTWKQRNSVDILMFSGSNNLTALVPRLSYVMVSGISKTAYYNRKWIWNNVYRSLCTWEQRNFNSYNTYVFGVKQHDCINPITVLCQGEWYISWWRPYSILTFGYRPPCLIYRSPWYGTVFELIQLCCWTSKT